MLYDDEGKAKIAIFSIAHLNDNERMFFVTILLNAYINWMRKQRGSSALKTILYMDEIFGFFPPSKNPPSKKPMLLLLKQARAFGTGVVLSTQNPVDLDYKGLSNIGTWFVGKLQTKQDIAKVLDPLSAKSDLSKSEISKKLTTLKGRHFFMKNVHSDKTIEFSTRWVLSYLKGPMTKDDIKTLMKNKKIKFTQKNDNPKDKTTPKADKKPMLSQDIKEYFLDTNINSQTIFYPYVYACAEVRYYNQKRAIDIVEEIKYKLELFEDQTLFEWENSFELEDNDFSIKANTTASYAQLPSIITHSKTLTQTKKTLSNYLYGSKRLEFFICKKLKLESKINQTKRDFKIVIEDELREIRDENLQKLEDSFETKFSRLENKLKRLEIKLQKEENDVSSKTSDTIIDVGLAIFGAFFGKKTISSRTISKGVSAFKKGKGVLKERTDVKNIESLIDDVENDIQELHEKLEFEIQKIENSINIENYEISSTFIKPRRSDIVIEDIAILWER
jgi:hypothetical protein